MEMPVLCPKCNHWVELNSTRESNLNKQLLCNICCKKDNDVKELLEEIEDIQYMLDNNDPEVKGDRMGWKANIKEAKNKISLLGYSFENLE